MADKRKQEEMSPERLAGFSSESGLVIHGAVASVKRMFPTPVVVVMDRDDATIESGILGNLATVVVCKTPPFPQLIPQQIRFNAIGMIANRGNVSADLLSQFSKLQLIVLRGNHGKVDLQASSKQSIRVTRVLCGVEESADTTMSFALTMFRKTNFRVESIALDFDVGILRLSQIRGKKFGLIGFDPVAVAVAKRATAFGFDVEVFDPAFTGDFLRALGLRKCETLTDLLSASDIVSLHCVFEGQVIIDSLALAVMKPTSFLVNVSDSRLVDEAALVGALESNCLGGAGLDCVEVNPSYNQLTSCHKALITPRIGTESNESNREFREKASHEVARYLAGPELKITNN